MEVRLIGQGIGVVVRAVIVLAVGAREIRVGKSVDNIDLCEVSI